MSFMEIKRFVNSGNTPLNTLIGTEINKINSDDNKALDVLIKELLNSGDNGLAVLKQLLLETAKESSVGEIEGLLKNSTYGLNALLNAMSSGSIGGVKSVQTGELAYRTADNIVKGSDSGKDTFCGSDIWYVDLSINDVNAEKTISIIEMYNTFGSSYGNGKTIRYGSKIVSANKLRVFVGAPNGAGIYSDLYPSKWTVIEFY